MQQIDPRPPSAASPPATTEYVRSNAGKLDLHATYDAPDPRAYFSALAPLDYHIPTAARPVFERTLIALREARALEPHAPIDVVDVGCSYGINGAVLKYGIAMSELYAWYAGPEVRRYSTEELKARDRQWLAARKPHPGLRVTGIDVAARAVGYARDVGLLDGGHSGDLEREATAAPRLPMDLIISTGCVGYATERTFQRLLDARTAGRLPWIATFALRMFPFDRFAGALDRIGYVTERLGGRTFVQRRFAGAAERRHVLARLREIGVDPTGLESDGTYHAHFYLSRPRDEHDGRRPDVLLGLS